MTQVLLVNMPFAVVQYPSAALSILKPLLEREGVACDISYFNVAFQEYSGRPDGYELVADRPARLGEWPFGEDLFGEEWARSARGRLDALVPPGYPETDLLRQQLAHFRSISAAFIQRCLEAVAAKEYEIIGFTSTFAQQVASLALARRIKERWPDRVIAFGGANCDGSMGAALLRLFPFVDWVFAGEADLSFPRAVRQWQQGRAPEGIPGIAYRRDGEVVTQGSGAPIDLESAPYPDFDDYFAALDRWAPAVRQTAYLTLELSRGCWWGEKSQCVFCGLNHQHLGFRGKSPQRAEAEIKTITARHGVPRVMLTDTILDMSFFKTLLPALADNAGLENMAVETKANLTRDQVRTFRSAGVRTIQPGIESLDSELLAHMHKGTTMLQNVQLLKWAREYGLTVAWNLLSGFPREDPEAYRRMGLLIPSIVHLHPPNGVTQLLLQRFSPLFERQDEWGIRNVRAGAEYHSLYPFGEQELDELAYNFDGDFDGKDDVAGYVGPLKQQVESWRRCWMEKEPPLLAFERGEDGRITIYDTRPGRSAPRVELEGGPASAYLACDARRPFSALAKDLRERMGRQYPGDVPLRRSLDDLAARRLMLREGEWYLALANDLEVLSRLEATSLALLLAPAPRAASRGGLDRVGSAVEAAESLTLKG